MDLLSGEELAAGLDELHDWNGDSVAIHRTHSCSSFPAAIAAVDRIAVIAEQMEHHPDIDIRWRTLTFSVTTHSEGGVTAADLELAHQIDEVLTDA